MGEEVTYQNVQPLKMLKTARMMSGQVMIGSLSWACAAGLGSVPWPCASVQRVFLVVNVRVNRLGLGGEPARLAGEGQEPHPEHVKRRQHRAHRREEEQQDMLGARPCTRARAAARIASFE